QRVELGELWALWLVILGNSITFLSELRCHCIRNVRRLMLPKHLANVEIIPKGPHCKAVEIIATLKNSQQICLDPQAKWVKMIINRILHSDFPLVQLKPTIN
uniref:C-X-C motif chemokine n=1 Tax=Anas platyrhynchos TaxID=8839 RepID=A0A8B9T464_ANAPL